jgi:mannose/fructose/N-acetylgalactosamine-specific phosphotransferase system component IID
MAGLAMVITPLTKLHIWLRLLLLQSSWNFERHQGLGFFYALLPGLKKLYSGPELLDVSRRYVGYFNTHPYLTPLVAGAVLKLEEELARGNTPPVDVDDFKEIVAAPYAAIGDALFWGGMRPLAAGIGLFFAIKGLLWAPLVFLVFFNAVPLWFRAVFFLRGYRQGLKSVEFIQQNRLPDWAVHTKETAIIILGGLSAFMVFAHVNHHGLTEWFGFLTIIPVAALAYTARKGISASWLIVIVSLVILLLGIFWVDLTQLLSF